MRLNAAPKQITRASAGGSTPRLQLIPLEQGAGNEPRFEQEGETHSHCKLVGRRRSKLLARFLRCSQEND